MSEIKVGVGYDIHRLEAGRKLVLGGVTLPFDRGLSGHSDGDALVHAVIDALLGALGEGDIGQLFPDTDPRFRGAVSTELLRDVVGRLRGRGAKIVNVDAVIVAEAPKMAPHIPAMKEALGAVLGLPPTAVGLKAKTAEGLGPVGEGRAIACWATALIRIPR